MSCDVIVIGGGLNGLVAGAWLARESLSMRHSRRAVLDPLPAALFDGVPYAIHPKLLIVVATNRQNRCDLAERANQVTEPAQLGGTVHQVASEQHHIRVAPGRGVQYLPAQDLGATVSEVNVTEIQQSTGVVSRREPLLPDVEGSAQPDFQRSAGPRPRRVRELPATRALDQ